MDRRDILNATAEIDRIRAIPNRTERRRAARAIGVPACAALPCQTRRSVGNRAFARGARDRARNEAGAQRLATVEGNRARIADLKAKGLPCPGHPDASRPIHPAIAAACVLAATAA